jgi:aminomethyltransferase
MVEWQGWLVPRDYAGIRAEHLAVRTKAGLFDLSHAGQIEIAGRDALAAVQRMTSNDAARLAVGQLQQSILTTDAGTFVDDILVYRLAREHFLFVVSAGQTRADVSRVVAQAGTFPDAAAVDTSSRYALVGLRGPAAPDVLQDVSNLDLTALRDGLFTHGEVAGVRATVSGREDTGELGFDILTAPQMAPRLWEALLRAGSEAGVVPAGLGAFDTLRLEAGMPLHGRDIDETTSVLEAGLERIIGWEKGEFSGRDTLARQRAEGVLRRLVGFEMTDRAIARTGYDVWKAGSRVGTVTSGTRTPFLERAIGMAYVPVGYTEPGTEIEVDVRGRRARARVVPLPFYTRAKG